MQQKRDFIPNFKEREIKLIMCENVNNCIDSFYCYFKQECLKKKNKKEEDKKWLEEQDKKAFKWGL